ncbi:hypothetical protein [Calothrix sp. PCC 7507]|uniref:hypothetical protein n=1 Tax=Calothrix sp. PCC 7507 TaxID=99598 RepID=UPI00029F3A97|nr:hypothetical protein [Calothrix sp. PCC 7507]AFY31646.1 hypothetical protein Cal7507_1172 [Calothrix sp. PCC 7507]
MEKYKSQIQINDLIDDAINNAITRRQEGLSELSNEQVGDITGGLASGVNPSATVGIISVLQPATTGLVDKNPAIRDTFRAS